MSIEFEISKLLEISAKQKYASTVAGFKIIDSLDQIEIPKKFQTRKPAVKAMIALSDGIVKWDFISEEARTALEEELRSTRKSHSALDAVFHAPGSAAPVSDELDEDLDEIGETAPPEEFVDETEQIDSDVDDEVSSDKSDDTDDDDDDDSDDDTDDDDDDSDDDEDVKEDDD